MNDRHIDWMLDSLLLIAVMVAAIIAVDTASSPLEIKHLTVSIQPVINHDTYCTRVRGGQPHYKIERDCR